MYRRLTLDPWQRAFMETEGDRVLCCGRQVGKSTVCAMDAGEKAVNNSNQTILIIAPTERQAFALFDKTLDYLATNYKSRIKKGKNRPTKTRIILTNNTKIFCLPTGLSGLGIRFLTVHHLYVDEGSRVPDPVWAAVTPMLLTTGGTTTILSTPAGSDGYFADVVNNRDGAFSSYSKFEISSQEVIENREICETWKEVQRDKALEHIERERARMSAREFAQEYEGKIIEDLRRFFSDRLIKKCAILKRRPLILKERQYYLGVDIARMGEDDSTFEIIDRTNRENLQHVESIVTRKTLTTETTIRILKLNNLYNFRQIFVDDGGMGVGVFDQLLTEDSTKRKTIAINNSRRPLDREEKQRKKTLKEDIYNNLLVLMEQSKIQLLDDEEVIASLRSVQYEYINGKLRIFGNYLHIVDGLVRAAWCSKDKRLNIYIH